MIGPLDPIYIDDRDSFPLEECVAKLLGWMQGRERLYYIEMDEHGIPPDKLPHLPNLEYPLTKYLDQLKERTRLELAEAVLAYENADEASTDKEALGKAIDEKEYAHANSSQLIEKAYFFRSEIKKELAKGEFSVLKIDHQITDEKGIVHVTLDSLDEWSKKNKYRYDLIKIPKAASNPFFQEEKPTLQDSSPWLITDPRDKNLEQHWYAPARYFARQLVKGDSTLLNRKHLLAQMVAKNLTTVGIFKRGGKLPLNSSTVKKAFSNMDW